MTLISRKDQRQLDRERKQTQRERRKRLEKAAPALLAACKSALSMIKIEFGFSKAEKELFPETTKEILDIVNQLQSAIEQAGEGK